MKQKKYYSYFVPQNGTRGVAESWEECEAIIHGESGARFKAFKSYEEAEAWLRKGADYGAKKELEAGIYFDAGTGRGQGVEISVTDEKGRDFLEKVLVGRYINRFGKHVIRRKVSNNYGELLACKYALEIALMEHGNRVFGDSKLILEYWSKGFVNKKEVSAETLKLIGEVKQLRRAFELKGGNMVYVPGDDNPADLGFHK